MRIVPVHAMMTGALLMMSALAYAGAGWTGFGHVAELTPTTQHRYVFRLMTDDNPSGCRETSFFFQDYTARGSQFMFRTLLSAIESGKKVRVYVTGRCDLDGYSEISSLTISR